MKLNAWIHQSIVAFGIFNTVLGIYLFFYHPSVPLETISPAIPQNVWAVLFLLTGLAIFYGLIKGQEKLVWYLMITGLFIKASWTFGFGFRIAQGGTLFALLLWAMIASWQFLVVRYFHNGRA